MYKLKHLFTYILLIASVISLGAQDRYLTRTGHVKFFSDELIEDITANNNEVMSTIDIKKNEVEVDIPIKAFVFRKNLMQKHFNENYLETERFPRATFKGTFDEVTDLSNRIDGTYGVNAIGELTIHGVTKSIAVPVQIIVGKKMLSANFVFNIEVADFDIKSPKFMFKKIAETMEVTGKFEYKCSN